MIRERGHLELREVEGSPRISIGIRRPAGSQVKAFGAQRRPLRPPLLSWAAKTVGTGLTGNGMTKQEVGESLALAVYGGIFDRWTFDFASDIVAITVALQQARLNQPMSK